MWYIILRVQLVLPVINLWFAVFTVYSQSMLLFYFSPMSRSIFTPFSFLHNPPFPFSGCDLSAQERQRATQETISKTNMVWWWNADFIGLARLLPVDQPYYSSSEIAQRVLSETERNKTASICCQHSALMHNCICPVMKSRGRFCWRILLLLILICS